MTIKREIQALDKKKPEKNQQTGGALNPSDRVMYSV